jgi:hypothetical protein
MQNDKGQKMIQVTKDLWVNIANVIWVQDVYDANQNYRYTKIVTIGGELIVTEKRAEEISSILKLD